MSNEFRFYSNTLRYAEAGVVPNKVPGWDFNWDVAQRVIQNTFSDKLEKPVWMATCKMLKRASGTWAFRGRTKRFSKTHTSWTLAEMDEAFLKAAKVAGGYHRIKVAEKDLDRAIGRGPGVGKFYPFMSWNLKRYYNPEIFRNYMAVVVFFHVIAHEFTHAMQHETGEYAFADYTKHGRTGFDKDSFSKYHQKSKKEMDAESGARHYGPMLVKAYLEMVAPDFYMRSIKPEWGI